MFPFIVFLVVLGAFLGGVWYAGANEDLRPAPERKTRFGALSRVYQSLRKRQSSPRATVPGQVDECKSSSEFGEVTTHVESPEDSRPSC